MCHQSNSTVKRNVHIYNIGFQMTLFWYFPCAICWNVFSFIFFFNFVIHSHDFVFIDELHRAGYEHNPSRSSSNQKSDCTSAKLSFFFNSIWYDIETWCKCKSSYCSYYMYAYFAITNDQIDLWTPFLFHSSFSRWHFIFVIALFCMHVYMFCVHRLRFFFLVHWALFCGHVSYLSFPVRCCFLINFILLLLIFMTYLAFFFVVVTLAFL